MDVEKELTRWVRAELVRERPADQPLARLVLRHAAPGAKGHEVETLDLGNERLTLEDAQRVAFELVSRAQTDADGMGGGPQRYVVQAYGRGDTKGSSRFAMTLRGNSEDDVEGIGGDDPPTLRGLVAQQMRHNEALIRVVAQVVGTSNGQLIRRMESMDAEMTKMREQRSADFLALESAKSEEHEREMSAMRELNQEKRKDQMFEKVVALLPAVANRLVGKNLLPNSKDPLVLMMEDLVRSLSPEQLQAIGRNLSPTQTIQFVEVLQTFQRNQQAKPADKDNAS